MASLNDILNNDEERLGDEELLNYLKGNASPEELHAIEMQMADSEFMNDAVEGLQSFKQKENLQTYVQQLNGNLQKQLDERKKRKEKRKLPGQSVALITIAVIIALCIIGYVVIKMHKGW